jgi:hypothetical protein
MTWAIARAKNMTKAFMIPCSSVMVTMSPLAMCAISCARTPSTSSRCIERIKPLDTATRLRRLLGPVANALTSGDS